MKINKVLKAGFGYTIGNFFIKGITFITLPIFTRLLSPTEYGLVNSYIAYETIISILMGLGLYGTIKNANYDFPGKLDSYMSSIFAITLIPLITLLVALNTFPIFFRQIIPFEQLIVNLMLLHAYAQAIIQILNIRFTLDFEYKKYLIISFVNTFLNISLSIILVLTIFDSNRYYGRVIGSALPMIIIGFIILFLIIKKGHYTVKKEMWVYGVRLGSPLIAHSLSQSVLAQFDKIMILSIVGASAAGIFGFINNISQVLLICYFSFDSVWGSWFYKKMDEKNYEEIQSASNIYVSFFSIITVTLILLGQEIIKLLSPSDYWDGIPLLSPMLLSVFFLFIYSLPVGIEFYYKKTKTISISTVIAALLNIVLNFIFINLFGYVAAAYTTLVTYVLLAVLHWNISKKISDIKIFDLKHFLKMILLVITSAIFTPFLNDFLILKYTILFGILLVFFMKNKRDIFKLLGKKLN